jgi:hypothetical protein
METTSKVVCRVFQNVSQHNIPALQPFDYRLENFKFWKCENATDFGGFLSIARIEERNNKKLLEFYTYLVSSV